MKLALSSNRRFIVRLAACFSVLVVTPLVAQERLTQERVIQERNGVDERQTDEPVQETKSTPELSVRSLFHPADKADYFGPFPPSTIWLSDSTLAVERGDEWEVIDPATGKKSEWDWPETLRNELEKLNGFSKDEIAAAVKRIVSSYETLDQAMLVRIGKSLAVVGGEQEPKVVTRDARAWDSPDLSPDGSSVAFVRENDIYVVKVASGEVLRVTSTGSPTRLNGRLDWTYQEEIYGRGNFKGFWWSPDSRHLAYLSIDISDVLPFTLTTSDSPRGGTLVTNYPKAGDPIPVASLLVVDSETLQSSLIHQPTGDESESLVVRVTWHPDGRRLTYQIQNRVQTWLELRQSDLAGSDTKTLLREEGPAWVEILGEPTWLPDGDFLWLSDLPTGRRHVWLVSADGSRRMPITSGEWDVRDLVRVLPEENVVFVTGDRQRGTRGQQLYRVAYGSEVQQQDAIEAMTERVGWHAVEVSPNGKWITDTFSTLTAEPMKYLIGLESDRRELLGPKSVDAAAWKTLTLSEPQWLNITTEDGVPLPAYVIPPHGVDLADSSVTYPVLIETYGGPQAPSAVDRWGGREYLFRQMLASRGIAVLVVDNRSSGGRGIADTWSIHRRVGVQELADLLEVVEYLKTTDWADPDRLAIRGWSFGGYYTAYAMTHSQAFAAGIAGGSVTDWRNYDAFYTERYMDTPQNNEAGYDQTSVLSKADELHGRLLLIHGEVDDNVHPGNTLQLIAALQQAGKQFELMLYPGSAHGIRDTNQVFHMRKMMTDFLVKTLRPGMKAKTPSE